MPDAVNDHDDKAEAAEGPPELLEAVQPPQQQQQQQQQQQPVPAASRSAPMSTRQAWLALASGASHTTCCRLLQLVSVKMSRQG